MEDIQKIRLKMADLIEGIFNMEFFTSIFLIAGLFLLLSSIFFHLRSPEVVAKREKERKIMLEKEAQRKKAYIKKLKLNPHLNIDNRGDDFFRVHMDRLDTWGTSEYFGITYYKGKRGGIYTLSASGTRNYKF